MSVANTLEVAREVARKEKGAKPKSLTPCYIWLPGPDSNQRQGG